MNDQELADILKIAKQANVTIHVRGTDKHPVVELRDKRTRQVVGGSEFKRRVSK